VEHFHAVLLIWRERNISDSRQVSHTVRIRSRMSNVRLAAYRSAFHQFWAPKCSEDTPTPRSNSRLLRMEVEMCIIWSYACRRQQTDKRSRRLKEDLRNQSALTTIAQSHLTYHWSSERCWSAHNTTPSCWILDWSKVRHINCQWRRRGRFIIYTHFSFCFIFCKSQNTNHSKFICLATYQARRLEASSTIAFHSCRSNRHIRAVPSLLPDTKRLSRLAYWILSMRSWKCCQKVVSEISVIKL
jgi:hypothetical protein